ncbi:MAG: hypothetical protein KAG64_04205 [Bacteroidales bacterium]|nr:hypothetical protein [Bacteroidales bacterium]
MKKILLLFLSLTFSSQIYSQTEKIEINNLSKRYQSGEFGLEALKEYGAAWQKLIQDMDGYPNLPYNPITKSLVFNYILDTKLEKEKVFSRILEWSAINFGSITNVLHYKSLKDGKIILKGNFEVNYRKDYKNFWGSSKEKYTKTTCYQTYVFTIIENKVKLEVINIEYSFHYYGYTYANTYIPSKVVKIKIDNIYPITNFDSDLWKENLDLLYQTNNNIIRISKNINDYINSIEKDYTF